jgi:hypothetical protein
MRRIVFFSLFASLAAFGCSGASDEGVASVEEAVQTAEPTTADTRPSFDSATPNNGALVVRAAGLGLSVDAVATRKGAGTELTVTLRGRATRNLTKVASFVPDDGFGEAKLTGKRSFEVALHGGHEVNTILSGLPLYVHLEVAASAAGAPTQYDAAIELVPVLEAASDAGAAPGVLSTVYGRNAENPLLYRARVAGAAPVVVTGPSVPTAVRSDAAGVTLVDWSYDALAPALALKNAPIGFGEAKATLTVRASRLGLTSVGVTTAWPEPTCAPEVLRCFRTTPDATPDYAACGPYRTVSLCAHAPPPATEP